jgi:hypothetical protein
VVGRLTSRGGQRLPLLAGWLFADLFLVLFLVGLASIPPKPHTRRPHPTPSPTHTAPRVLDRTPISFHLNVQPADFQNPGTRHAAATQLLVALGRKIRNLHLQGRQAGFVLVFASGPSTAIGQAVATADSVVRIVRTRSSEFSEASGLGYWNGAGNYFKFVVFFYSSPA